MQNTPSNWKELKGQIKQKWAQLTDDDILRAEGNWDEISGKIQKVYGYSKEKAIQEVEAFKNKFLNKADQKMSSSSQKSTPTGKTPT